MSKRSPRTRRDVVAPSYTGMTLAHWQASRAHVEWAQSQAQFADALAVCANARNDFVCVPVDAVQCARALGQREGYERMLAVLGALAQGAVRSAPEPEPTYTTSDASEPLD